MLDICLLGTGGMMPLPERYLTAMLARYNGSKLLIDCGEGTQVTMKILGWGYKSIDIICITHFHGDHITGLPGLILTIGNSGRTETLKIVGPPGLKKVFDGLMVICHDVPFNIELVELPMKSNTIQLGDYVINTIVLNHKVPCFGYTIEIKRSPKFIVEKAILNKVPQQAYKYLQNGEIVQIEGKKYTPDMVLGESRKGFKVSYVTDTRPTEDIVKGIYESDLFICEGMYMEKENIDQVKKYKHMLGVEAAKMAKIAKVDKLWLTHYSPALPNNKLDITQVKEIFENSELGIDRKVCTLTFKD
ncbi:MAG: ribonuclease Z [Epulopiscium sp. Nuni2H_MBin003]|nr:MAG: ribonuclease Z [Epulopiscium sp. Nuni2H_MBin003]